jgi:hypothetical protein
MKKMYISILVGCAFMFISTGSGEIVLPHSFVSPVFAEVPDTDSSGSCLSSEAFPYGIILAKQGKEKYDCLEPCAKKQYQCETDNNKKNQNGKKKHWEGSRDCENLYRSCLDKCE